MSTHAPTHLTIASDALLLRLLELEESAHPDRGQGLADMGAGLPDPLGEWVGEHAVGIRARWRRNQWITEPGESSLGYNDAQVKLTRKGMAQAEQVRNLRAGPWRDRAARSRILLYLDHQSREGEYPVSLAGLEDIESPWSWLADRPLDGERDIARATRYLDSQGMFTDITRIEEAGIVLAGLSAHGTQAVEALTIGAQPPGSGHGQVINNNYGPVHGNLVQGRDVHGGVHVNDTPPHPGR